jgi:hypothetical protein
LPLQNFADGARKLLIYIEAASLERQNRRFGVELGKSGYIKIIHALWKV